MFVKNLTGALLDYWVAKAVGVSPLALDRQPGSPYEIHEIIGINTGIDNTTEGNDHYGRSVEYRPSERWDQGGPIIERERITVIDDFVDIEPSGLFNPELCRTQAWRALHGHKDCSHNFEYGADIEQYGETYLIAAMRAYVASKYGDEVPDSV